MTRFAFVAVVLGASLAGCGKQGPPLAPFVHIPGAVEPITVRRVGDEIYLSMTVPTVNVDDSTPVDIARIDVHAYTARTTPSIRRLLEGGSLVASVKVDDSQSATAAPVAVGAEAPEPGPGDVLIVKDRLTPENRQPSPEPPDSAPRRAPVAAPVPATVAPLRRYYGAVAFSPRGLSGPPQSVFADVVLTGLPDTPSRLHATYTASNLTLTWQPSGGLVGFLLERSSPLAPPDEDVNRPVSAVERPGSLPPPPTTYNVYLERAPDPLTLTVRDPLVGAVDAPPAPLNETPITTLSLIDDVQFERVGCYSVRAVRGSGVRAVESETSEQLCVKAVDVFPPLPPRSLTAVPSENAVSLIWELNDELDLAGYLVLRGKPGDATLLALTQTPVAEPRYRDASVTPGVNYVYAVVAVDSRLPAPNVSAESTRVVEMAR